MDIKTSSLLTLVFKTLWILKKSQIAIDKNKITDTIKNKRGLWPL